MIIPREMSYRWKVVPLCKKQLLDVDPDDILNDGYFRRCNVYKSGGGYDMFPNICEKRLGVKENTQFVVQLFGCPLKCYYCYVTKDGVWGDYKEFQTFELIENFIDSDLKIFHLMGGAPALYIEYWKYIIDLLPYKTIFHSDLLLIEKDYTEDIINSISKLNCIYSVNIKGGTKEEFFNNTGVNLNIDRFIKNLDLIVNRGLEFYFTFTGMGDDTIELFKNNVSKRYGDYVLRDSFKIDLIEYQASK
jgi:uncharacterized Fe-S cluster-containing radical SAM superfamily protein